MRILPKKSYKYHIMFNIELVSAQSLCSIGKDIMVQFWSSDQHILYDQPQSGSKQRRMNAWSSWLLDNYSPIKFFWNSSAVGSTKHDRLFPITNIPAIHLKQSHNKGSVFVRLSEPLLNSLYTLCYAWIDRKNQTWFHKSLWILPSQKIFLKPSLFQMQLQKYLYNLYCVTIACRLVLCIRNFWNQSLQDLDVCSELI